MKKRLLVITLMILILTVFMIPVLAGGTSYGKPATELSVPGLEHNRFISVMDEKNELAYRAYAVCVNGDAAKLKWKDIKAADLRADGRLDLSKEIKNPGTLVLSTVSKETCADTIEDIKALNKNEGDAANEGGATYMLLDILKPGDKPAVPGAPRFVSYTGPEQYNGVLVVAVYGGPDDNLEYSDTSDSEGYWIPWTGELAVLEMKKTYYLRTKATAANGPSEPVKVTVPKIADPPKIKID